jgi:puromycin-sensitive aminopeptidase
MFDVLTYEKGASVLWMLEAYLGRERFRAGVRRYLEQHQYGNTETTDLWDAIEAEADEPVREIMDSWIFQGGYPLVRARREAGAGELTLSEEPFSYLGASENPEGASAIGSAWIVPMIARELAGEERRILLSDAGTSIEANGTPLVLNAGGSGFYRLFYEGALGEELLGRLDELAPAERYNLVADTWAVVLAGRGELSSFLSLVDHLSTERDPNVWSLVIGALGLIDLVCAEDDRPALAAYARELLSPLLEAIGFEPGPDEDELTPLLRSSLIAALGTIGRDGEIQTRCRALFEADHSGTRTVPADLAGAVLAVVASHASPAEFSAILDRYRRPESPLDEVRHLNALGAVRDPELAAQVHVLCRDEIRSQNAPYVLSALLRSRDVGPATFAFISENFSELSHRFPDNSIHRMLDGVSGLAEIDGRGRPLYLAEVRAFCDHNILGPRRRLVSQSIERLMVNIAFARSLRQSLAGLLSAKGQ